MLCAMETCRMKMRLITQLHARGVLGEADTETLLAPLQRCLEGLHLAKKRVRQGLSCQRPFLLFDWLTSFASNLTLPNHMHLSCSFFFLKYLWRWPWVLLLINHCAIIGTYGPQRRPLRPHLANLIPKAQGFLHDCCTLFTYSRACCTRLNMIQSVSIHRGVI